MKWKERKEQILFILLCPVAIYVWCFWDPPPLTRKATRIDSAVVDRALPQRFRTWYEYALDLDYYEDARRLDSSCGYKNSWGPLFGKDDIYVHGIENIDCLAHEVGHHIDDLWGVSKSDEFRHAVETSIALWENLPEGAYHWRWRGETVAEFPGINGNPLTSTEWGGYGELYAYLHEIDYLIQMPPPLQKYFEDFIPWGWWGK
jgi:hypothetical protein